MKFYLYIHNIRMINELIEMHPEFQEVFVFMLVKERDNRREYGQEVHQ